MCLFAAVLRVPSHALLMARSEQEALSGLIAPISAVERSLLSALLRPRSRSRSPLPNAVPGRSRGVDPLGCPSRVVLRPP